MSKDGTERDLGESFYKYSGINMGMDCEGCKECANCKRKRERILKKNFKVKFILLVL